MEKWTQEQYEQYLKTRKQNAFLALGLNDGVGFHHAFRHVL